MATQYEPYPCLKYEARYDGVVQTRKSLRERGSRYELGVFEVSSKFRGIKSGKWKKDRTKLLAGCRAMLYRLQESVNYDPDTVKKLQVVGVLQAGKSPQKHVTPSGLSATMLYLGIDIA